VSGGGGEPWWAGLCGLRKRLRPHQEQEQQQEQRDARGCAAQRAPACPSPPAGVRAEKVKQQQAAAAAKKSERGRRRGAG
jgi:hypothetical protein